MLSKNKGLKVLLTVCIVLFNVLNSKAVLCVALANGDWNTGSNWSCGTKPACGDSIVIPAGITVTITSQQDYTACGSGPDIVIYGVLKFDNGNKLQLPCSSQIYIMPGGSVQPGTGGGNSNNIEICNDILWQAGDGTLTGPSCLPPSSFCSGVVLPVELVSFTGEAKDGYISLDWITATERKSSYFDVERSTDASSFIKIVRVASKATYGNSTSMLRYNTTDNAPENNISYYRLKQVDLDNTFEYSGIISVNYIKAKNIKFIVYPNPNKGEFTADISGIENNHEVTISLRDEKGRMVYNSSFYIQDQSSSKLNIIPESHLVNGIYVCTLTLEGIEFNVKVVVN